MARMGLFSTRKRVNLFLFFMFVFLLLIGICLIQFIGDSPDIFEHHEELVQEIGVYENFLADFQSDSTTNVFQEVLNSLEIERDEFINSIQEDIALKQIAVENIEKEEVFQEFVKRRDILGRFGLIFLLSAVVSFIIFLIRLS